MRTFRTLIASLICLSLSVSTGCNNGDGLTRNVVSGTVSLEGVPVEDGQIRFMPIDGTAGPTSVSPIRQGKYSCDYRGGVPVGTHRVEILVWDPSVPAPLGPGAPVRPQWAPDNYNQNSELTMMVEDTGRAIEKNWELSK